MKPSDDLQAVREDAWRTMMKLEKFKSWLLFFGLFMLTLINHSIYAHGIALALVGVYLVLSSARVSSAFVIEGVIFSLVGLIYAVEFLVASSGEVLDVYRSAFWGNAAKVGVWVCVWVVMRTLVLTDDNRVKAILKVILWIHVSAFYVQYLAYTFADSYIDLVQPFTGEESRYMTFDRSLSGIGSVRPTGFFTEPSNYSMVVAGLLTIFLSSTRSRADSMLIGFALVSMYLSFSTAAVIIASLLVLFILLSGHRRTAVGLSLLLVLLLGAGLLSDRGQVLIQSQVTKFENTSGIRFALPLKLLEREGTLAIFGPGPFYIENSLAEAVGVTRHFKEAAPISDSGLFIGMWVVFGWLGWGAFFGLSQAFYKVGSARLGLFLIFSLSKVSVFYPIFVVTILSLMHDRKTR